MMTERERDEVFHAPFQLVTPIMQEKPKNTFRKSWSESISSRTLLHQNHQKRIIMKKTIIIEINQETEFGFIGSKEAARIDMNVTNLLMDAKSAERSMKMINQTDLSGHYELGMALIEMEKAIKAMKAASENLSRQWDYISK